jgi:hypothetical protein
MAFQLSPGVNVSEIDLTTIVPSVATSIGAFAGPFAWGPADEIITISDEVRLADRFGKPNNTNYEHWFSAANFLAYTNTLKIVRAINIAESRNAIANSHAAARPFLLKTKMIGKITIRMAKGQLENLLVVFLAHLVIHS